MRCEEILRGLRLEEKIALCSGSDCWHTKDMSGYGLPSMMMCDGPHGLRCQKDAGDMLGINRSEPATCFPTAALTACSWDPALLEKIGRAIGEEARAAGVGLVLGPGVNIKRDPLCGRNFEYFSEDPCLAGRLAASFILGVQQTGAGACLKHFALNNQEYKRLNGSSQADARTMREIYLAPFEAAVKEGRPAAVMCAYNKINGVHCSDSKELLTDILREEWGFDGLVVTDWNAMNDRIAAMKAGCDLSMPGGSDYMEEDLALAVAKGELSESDIDQCALRVLRRMEQAKRTGEGAGGCDAEAHHALARQAAAESGVLLKNEGILPIPAGSRVALIGYMAESPRYQGAGSSHINPTKTVSAKEAMPEAAYAPGCLPDGSTTEALLAQAAETARGAEIAVVFAGLTEAYECEGFDRENLRMPQGHTALIETVAAANPNTAVVLCCGGAVECDWADRVKAVLYMGLAGQASGEAAADLLYGRVNPSGKLAESWPLRYEDCPTAGCYRGRKDPQYREGIYVGYRYYDKAKASVRWPFGYGLSYTSFAYSGLQIGENSVRCTVTNTGGAAGAETVQLYIAAPQTGLHRPVKELKGFQKVFLEPGEEREVSFLLDGRSFSLWDDGWKQPGGDYTLLLCSDSRSVRLRGSVPRGGENVPAPAWQAGSWYEAPKGTPEQGQWELLYGRAVEDVPLKKGQFTMDNTVAEMMGESFVMRCLYRAIKRVISRRFGGERNSPAPELRMYLAFCTDSPLRSMQISTGLKGCRFRGLLDMANGHPFRGFLTLCGVRKRKP